MLARCVNPKNKDYPRYGGRGVKVRYSGFEAFLVDMGQCPPDMSIDRKDNDGDYEPGNCRWATNAEQARNRGGKRRSRLVVVDGRALCLADAAKLVGLPIKTIHNRLNRGLSDDDACAAFDYRCYNHF